VADDDLIANDELDALIRSANASAPPEQDGAYRVRLERRNEVLYLVIEGRVLQAVPHEFEARVEQIIDLQEAPRAVLDLTRCDYVSSSVMGFLLKVFKAAESRHGQMLMLQPNDRILKMLELVGLDQFFLTVDDDTMATAYFAEMDRQRPDSGPKVRRSTPSPE
jgi:anti-anti-sigma factor